MGKHDPVGQAARRISGETAENLVRDLIGKDPKFRGWDIRVTGAIQEGLDIFLYPPNPCKEGQTTNCQTPLRFEAKSIEKLFEADQSTEWPHNRVSRFVLKQNENPDCYVFITRDDIVDRTAVDFIANAGELARWKEKQGGKSQKLSVRAIPRLRQKPCPYVTEAKRIVRESDYA